MASIIISAGGTAGVCRHGHTGIPAETWNRKSVHCRDDRLVTETDAGGSDRKDDCVRRGTYFY